MSHYDFMLNAFAAAGITAVLAGSVGFFLVLRQQTFAGHALSHIGFSGAVLATLLGISSLWGLVAFTVLAGILMGGLSENLNHRDAAIGVVLSFSLGCGVLFLFFAAHTSAIHLLLFGNVLGVSRELLNTLLVLGILSLVMLTGVMRPLLFATLHSELAQAKGVPVRWVGIVFLVIVALTVVACTQIVGVLLVFTLMVGPAAAAQNWTYRLGRGLMLSIGLALICAWGGIAAAYLTNWPCSFWISAFSAGMYLLSLIRS